ncbi:hypothetical protein UFOVP71_234 [uncultured Caudovirales phage]|uniref:Uncharacterized protein n=1 Tax=uncultured Caudovirales phage TaxID=2100421 RepID=A0A6J5T9W4_9CAUD|nr:hypothetical protein UFOVP71_234 [uncultured Caudovirales phage]
MTIQEINKAIMFGTFTNDELTSIGDAIRFNRAQLAKATKRSVSIGCSVKFTDPRSGRVHVGTVKQIKIKNITVDCATYGRGGMVNVPANMLEAA